MARDRATQQRQVEHFALAQRTLAGFMRPKVQPVSALPSPDRPGLLAARTIATGQIRLAEAFATWADKLDASDLADRFRARVPRYAELHRSTLRLTELQPARSPLVVAQQSEMTQQLRRHSAPRISIANLHDLDDATHELTINVGKALRREGLRHRNILILDTDAIGPPGARPITNTRERFNLACRQLARDPEPDTPRTAFRTRSYRTLLAESLEVRPPTRPLVVRCTNLQ